MPSLIQEEGLEKGAHESRPQNRSLPSQKLYFRDFILSPSVVWRIGIHVRRVMVKIWRLHGAACTVTSYAIRKMLGVLGVKWRRQFIKRVYTPCLWAVFIFLECL